MKKTLSIINFELKSLNRFYIWWNIAWISMILLIVPFYSSISEESEKFGELYENLPEGIRVAFSLDANTLSTIEGFINTELVELLVLATSILGLYFGARSIQREINNKSLLFLVTKPVSRFSIFFGKAKAVLISSFFANAVLFGFVYFAAEIMTTETISLLYVVSSFLVIMLYLFLYYSLGLMLGVLREGGSALGVGVVAVISTFMFNIVSNLSDKADFLKYLTPYYYLDLKTVINDNVGINLFNYFIILSITVTFFIIGYLIFKNKDIDT
ncbi:ABC transporter permease subunit [Candidatus Dojkabacteria bacterium]|uniref:ABC transporter permease subunit n=1 Tax=Candidatus Dojkabacteria bacterium TaxID=2099670 RepID=A0A955RLD9_9BACT|nr:ABC transporter permease subunit [Candidatus Dojkabacteria bacterium]